ncbi:protein phosphatase 2C ABI1 [Trichodelitschia bisporula]|uniref:Protein phosphatase 2C ABI1 n=1 Tax=Trichodelitschia bisporula TaxID=703511 RepID=A0A6G1HP75_9PEZI|nr:protein phosphatase 2C ABI1 [Trichodelitschia bisporula]
MFGSSAHPPKEGDMTSDALTPGDSKQPGSTRATSPGKDAGGSSSAGLDKKPGDVPVSEKKRRASGVAKAKDIFSSAKQSLHLRNSSPSADRHPPSAFRVLNMSDPALNVPQGPHNNSAGESLPSPLSTFRVGVTEDKNKKCRRTMEDTHAYLYNFLSTPSVNNTTSDSSTTESAAPDSAVVSDRVTETDNGYFAIFDGHAGTFAADWCGKKLHHILEDTIRRNPNTPIPELLDQTFTQVDQQLEKLPVKNSGCTAVIAVLRWEDRVPNPASATGSIYLNQVAAKASANAAQNAVEGPTSQANADVSTAVPVPTSEAKLRESATRQRVLYTANVGDARIVLCRNGRALRLSYDHKGSDEQEGRRVANAGGLILNNRVNGVLAVTRALGDAYMKDLVTGHPYTTETVIQPDIDEFLILACDGLWDVCSDQEAVDLVRNVQDPQAASKQLVDHALARFSTDNLSCMIVRFDNKALKERKTEASVGVDGDSETAKGGIGETDAIIQSAKQLQEEEKIHSDVIIEEEERGPEFAAPNESGSEQVKAAQLDTKGS